MNQSHTPNTPVTGWSPDLPDARRRTCHNNGCTETLVYRNGDQITEAFAISLGQWLTVMGETLQPVTESVTEPDGVLSTRTVGFHVRSDIKTFCSTQCLKEYIDAIVAEYDAAEDRVVEKMKTEHPDIEKLRDAAYGLPPDATGRPPSL